MHDKLFESALGTASPALSAAASFAFTLPDRYSSAVSHEPDEGFV
jgi:hypothetical protein